MAELKIGQVAMAAGVGIDTIRYYERLGLLPKAARRASGYRVFDNQTIERVKLVKQLQDLGLSLEDIDAMMRAVGERDAGCSHEAARIRGALARTEERLAALTAVRDKLRRAVRRCRAGECRLVEEIGTVVR